MRRLSLCLLCLASPALAETNVRQAVIDVAKASNCIITEDIAEASFPALGLTQDDVGIVVEDMVLADEAELIDNALHLSPALCSGAAEVAPVEPAIPPVSPLMAKVIEVFQAHGCTMDEAAGMPALMAAGLTEEDLDSLTDESDALVEVGLMIRDETTYSISIVEPLCSGPVAASDPAEPLIQMLTENGCTLTPDAAGGLVANYGLTMETADEMADSLMDRGLARLEGDNLVLMNCGD